VQAFSPGVIQVSGQIAAGAQQTITSWEIQHPADFARTAFIDALRRAGVSVAASATGSNPARLLPNASAYRAAQKVAERVSPPLSQYVKVILKVSYNRGADLMVCLAAAKSGSRDCVRGLGTELKTITALGVSSKSTILFDGAGSVDSGRTSPADQTTFLSRLLAEPWGRYVRDGMPIMGVDGTQAMNERGTPSAGHIRGKDGSRAGGSPDGQLFVTAKTLVGYMDAKSGRKLVYAVFLNDVPAGNDMLHTFTSADRDVAAVTAAIQQGY
jgi:D-alanyl-D-alanine carboxypeptidase/D-alanyl-D-alanine-endopeptidase (penicillin-binding protein 4)